MIALADHTDEQLRAVAILADACLAIESARLYGFIQGGPTINVDRAEEVIAYARGERGLTWTEEERTEAAREFVAQANAEAEQAKDRDG